MGTVHQQPWQDPMNASHLSFHIQSTTPTSSTSPSYLEVVVFHSRYEFAKHATPAALLWRLLVVFSRSGCAISCKPIVSKGEIHLNADPSHSTSIADCFNFLV